MHRSSKPPSGANRLRWALGVGVLVRARHLGCYLHNDAYISFRYARNLVRRAGRPKSRILSCPSA